MHYLQYTQFIYQRNHEKMFRKLLGSQKPHIISPPHYSNNNSATNPYCRMQENIDHCI